MLKYKKQETPSLNLWAIPPALGTPPTGKIKHSRQKIDEREGHRGHRTEDALQFLCNDLNFTVSEE